MTDVHYVNALFTWPRHELGFKPDTYRLEPDTLAQCQPARHGIF